jgi:hypothetical protein
MDLGFPKKLFRRVIEIERQGLFNRFWELMGPSSGSSLLEIGGPTEGFSNMAGRFNTVVVANIGSRGWKYETVANYVLLQANACQLPFPDGAFDYVFSNATLEHIPKENWSAVAREVQRVATKGFFVATPNFWFPFEPHYLLPGFQWVPEGVKRFLLFRLGLKLGHLSKQNYEVISLPRKSQLSRAFNCSSVDGWGALIPRHLFAWAKY